MKPLLKQIRTIIEAHNRYPLLSLYQRITALESTASVSQSSQQDSQKAAGFTFSDNEISELLAANVTLSGQRQHHPTETNTPEINFAACLKHLEDNVAMLKKRTLGDGVNFRSYNFQSAGEHQDWLKNNLPNLKFGVFVDGFSAWEYFFKSDNSELNDYLNEDYATHKVGFKSLHESLVANSFYNVLPSALGKGLDKSEFLPAFTRPELWDNNDGSSGLRYRLTRELNSVRSQVIKNIEYSIPFSASPARILAIECLQHSLHFIAELSAYITRSYTELCHSGTFSTSQCWSPVSRCARRCFTDMSDARVTAKDIKEDGDEIGTATEIVWATLRTHMVMQNYLSENFDVPCICICDHSFCHQQ